MGSTLSLLNGVDESLASVLENVTKGRSFVVSLRSGDRLRSIRTEKLKMTQREFSLAFGIPLKTLQKWEQNDRQPDGPTRAYLTVIEKIPEQVLGALRSDVDERVMETIDARSG